MEHVIQQLRALNESVPVPLLLPEEDDLVHVEEALLIPLPRDLREFLLTVSDVIHGHLEPVTASDPGSHTYLPEVAAIAWSYGLPRTLIPICETTSGYYCIDTEGTVHLWKQGQQDSEYWQDIWQWAEEIWLQS